MTIPANDYLAGPYVLPIGRFANIFLKAQNATIAPTTALAAAPQGLYRISLSICILTAGTGGQLTLSCLGANSTGGTVTQSLVAAPVATVGSTATGEFIFEQPVTPGNIQYQVTAAGLTAGSLSYTVRVVIEKLSALT